MPGREGPPRTDGESLFRLLREPKKLALYDGGHLPDMQFIVPVINRFLDETLGPVE